MSKERAKRRAEERARKSAPKSRNRDEQGSPANRPEKKKQPVRSAREARRRRRIWLVVGGWLLANLAIWVFTDTWNARWLGLTLTTIAVPLVVWLVWDPQRRVNL